MRCQRSPPNMDGINNDESRVNGERWDSVYEIQDTNVLAVQCNDILAMVRIDDFTVRSDNGSNAGKGKDL